MHTAEFEVLESFLKPYCPICRLSQESAKDYLAGVLGDGVNDPKLRSQWRRRGGLCGHHWHVLRGLSAAALPAAILARDLLSHYLSQGRPEKPNCPACEARRDAEARYLKALLKVPEDRLLKALEDGRGFLCLEHLDNLPRGKLREAFTGKLKHLLEELAEFERKHDYRFSHEPYGSERDSWLRALRALGGDV